MSASFSEPIRKEKGVFVTKTEQSESESEINGKKISEENRVAREENKNVRADTSDTLDTLPRRGDFYFVSVSTASSTAGSAVEPFPGVPPVPPLPEQNSEGEAREKDAAAPGVPAGFREEEVVKQLRGFIGDGAPLSKFVAGVRALVVIYGPAVEEVVRRLFESGTLRKVRRQDQAWVIWNG